jgi:hypothetical protein
MNQESSADQGKVEVVFCGDLVQGEGEDERAFFKVAFDRPIQLLQVRIVRGGTVGHGGLKESVTQRGDEIERLEIFARRLEGDRRFDLVSSTEKIAEKGNHDTIIPIDPNYTVFSSITPDRHGPGRHPRPV